VSSTRIAFDTHSRYVTKAGSARYVDGLLEGFRSIRPAGMEFVEFAWPVENLGYAQPARALRTLYRETVWSRTVAPRALRQMGADLLHRTTPLLPIATPRGLPEVVTLHDVAPLRDPARFRRWHRVTAAARMKRLHRATRVICSSRFTADEAHILLGLPVERLDVVPLGNPFASGFGPREELRPAIEIPDRFFLFVGSLEPGKNLGLLAEAYARAASSPLPPLVVVGARRLGVAREDPPPARWHYAGHQPDAALAWLYRHAIALLFPSRYEGFGLPVLEAMSFGCPVVCSRVTSLPEVAGDAACYADMTPAAYLDAMTTLASDELARRQFGVLGRQQAARFSWDTCATDTAAIYRSVLRC